MTKAEQYARHHAMVVQKFEDERWHAHLREHDRDRQNLDRTAISLSEKLLEMNEIRGQIGEERGKFITREEIALSIKALDGRIDAVMKTVQTNGNRLSNYDGRMAAYGAAILFVAALISIAIRFIP